MHIASGFLLEEAPGERVLVTAGHFAELVHRCLDLGIVEGICVHHQDRANEQNLKQYILDAGHFKSQTRIARNGIDVGVVAIEEELSQSLDENRIPSIATEKHCGKSEERKSCLVIGYSASGSTTVKLSSLEVIADGEHETHERHGIGNICGRFEQRLNLEEIPEWQLFRDYKACSPECSESDLAAFLRSKAIPQCGLCPSKRQSFHHPDPTQRSELR